LTRKPVQPNILPWKCEELKKENKLLKLQQDSYSSERATLIDKNEQARKRVEAMITRLKSMEVTA